MSPLVGCGESGWCGVGVVLGGEDPPAALLVLVLDFGSQACQAAQLLVLEGIHTRADGFVVCDLVVAQVLMQAIGAVLEDLVVPAQLQAAIGKLHDVDRGAAPWGVGLAGLDLQDRPFKATTALGAELALVVQRADARELVR
jgi:hypothetical protein